MEAVNQIFLIFHDAPDVLSAMKAFHESIAEPSSSPELRNQRLLELFKSMARRLKIKTEPLGDGFFMKAFTINSLRAPQPGAFEFSDVHIQDGQPAIAGSLCFESGPKVSYVLPSEVARLVGCTMIELAAFAREREPDLRRIGVIKVGDMGPAFMESVQQRRARNE